MSALAHRLHASACALLVACAATGAKDERSSSTSGSTSGSGLVLADMDLAADPACDFYRFANGGWMDQNEIPADESSWGAFHEVHRRNEETLHALLERAASGASDPLLSKLGDFYASGMDEAAIDALGIEPIAGELARIDALEDARELPECLAHMVTISAAGPLGVFVLQDFTDASRMILFVGQSGFGLPDRDYYLRTDEEARALREQYVAHVTRAFTLAGDEPGRAGARATAVFALETALAKKSFGALDFRDPSKLANVVSVAEAQALVGGFDLAAWIRGIGADPAQPINAVAPDYFREVARQLDNVPLSDWKSYLRWQVLRAWAPYLGRELEQESFAFFGRVLAGQAEQQERWRRVLGALGQGMGEALGQAFVGEAFSPRAKQRCQAMVADLLVAFRARLEANPWMGDATRQRALEKLATFTTKIGYPERWRDWSALEIRRDAYAANALRAAEFEHRWQVARAGRPVDKGEWGMPAHAVNAYYNPSNNEIVFPAGILQPPFFSEGYDDALNYGGMGCVIGHEITHGFDDQGSKFDAQGNLSNWWSEADRAEFEQRAGQVVAQYASYEAKPGLFVDGQLTLGENIADLGGVTIAYDALQRALTGNERGVLDGFTPEQRFFLAWARFWRTRYTDAALDLQVRTNSHSPGHFRATGPLANLEAFARAFAIRDGAPMLREPSERALIW
jgi:putative endopeptidase